MESGARSRYRSILDLMLIAAFAGGLAYPSIDPIVRPHAERTELAEFRSPAALPEHPTNADQWLAFSSAYEAWFNDHFGLRDKLVRWHNVLDWFGFGVSPTPKLVLGDDAWIYYAEDKALDVYRGAYPLSPNELEGWRTALAARHDWLAAQNIRYLFVIVPNKDQVYPEHLPRAFTARGRTRSDQLIDCLRAHSDVDVLDLRPALIAAKRDDHGDDRVYYRLGTHWTSRGAYAGYTALIEHLAQSFPALAPIPRDRFEPIPGDDVDTWGPHLYMGDLLHQSTSAWRLRPSGSATYDAAKWEHAVDFESTNKDASLPRAFVFHDSFAPVLRPWLAENFAEVRWIWGWAFETKLAEIEAMHPDVVIDMFVDRVLVQDYPQVSGVQGPGPRRKAFTQSARVLARFDASNQFAGVQRYGRAVLRRVSDAMELEISTATDGVLIPAIPFPPGEDVIIAIDIDSTTVATLDLFFQKRSEPTFERRRVCFEKIYKGGSTVYLRLYAGDLAGPMYLHWRQPGTYTIHSIEARAVRE
jgi:hypothetical protein